MKTKAKTKKNSCALSCTVPNHIAFTALGLLFLMVLLVAVLLNRSTGTISWQPTVKTTASQGETKKLVDFVNKAAVLVEEKGEKAFSELRRADGQWWTNEAYIFVYDLEGNTLVLPPSPELEGTNRLNTKDENGVRYVGEMINTLKTKDSGWLEYSYPKPSTKNPVKKLAYFKKVKTGNRWLLVGSGIYLK